MAPRTKTDSRLASPLVSIAAGCAIASLGSIAGASIGASLTQRATLCVGLPVAIVAPLWVHAMRKRRPEGSTIAVWIGSCGLFVALCAVAIELHTIVTRGTIYGPFLQESVGIRDFALHVYHAGDYAPLVALAALFWAPLLHLAWPLLVAVHRARWRADRTADETARAATFLGAHGALVSLFVLGRSLAFRSIEWPASPVTTWPDAHVFDEPLLRFLSTVGVVAGLAAVALDWQRSRLVRNGKAPTGVGANRPEA